MRNRMYMFGIPLSCAYFYLILGKFNETAQCEEACHTYVGGTCYSFTFFTYG